VTTGWALFIDGLLDSAGQIATATVPELLDSLDVLLQARIRPPPPVNLIMERYAIYPDKAGQHIGSTVHTIQVIGAIKMYAALDWPDTPIIEQGAGQAKGFGSTAKLKAWKMWQTAQPHANDAIRHGVYFLTFGLPKSKR